MTARRIKSLHHNLNTKNVPFHREHRAKKDRKPNARYLKEVANDYKKKLEALKLKELEAEEEE